MHYQLEPFENTQHEELKSLVDKHYALLHCVQ